MKFASTPIADLMLVETTTFGDERGGFTRIFCDTEFTAARSDLHWRQMNISRTLKKGTVRGMHFQRPPSAEVKLIRCLRGKVFDVAVDIRAQSPTFLHWYGIELCGDGATQFLIPEGFAHGFQALTDDVEMLYLHSQHWARDDEDGLRHDDPALGISWPLPAIHVSKRDLSARLVSEGFEGVRL